MLTPLWLDRPHPTFPPLSGEAVHDVCVVGGGLTGLLSALLFARAGRRVVVLEARHVPAGTTGRTTAKISLLQGTRLSRASRTNPPATLRQYVDANREGQAWLRRFCEDHRVRIQDKPAWTYATTEQGEGKARREVTAARRAGLDAVWSPEVDLPFPTRGGARLDGQFQVHATELVEELVDEVLAEGGAIHEGSRVVDVDREGAGVIVRTQHATVRAGHAVLATNQPIGYGGAWFARLEPQRSYAAAFRSSWTPPGMYLSADRVTRSIRSVPEGEEELVLVGGNGHTTGRGPDERQQLDGLVSWAAESLPVGACTHRWSAQDQASLTGLPYVGPVAPGGGRVFVATGFDKWGFANAAAAALLISKTVLGDSRPPWAGGLSAWSPRELAGLPRAALVNASVGVHLARGWASRVVRPGDSRPPVCTHLGGVLRWNDAEDSWDCPLHGSRFAPDGAVLEGPACRPLDLG